MHETTGIQEELVRTRVEDVVPPEMLADPLVDRAHLEEVFAAPEKFLPEPVPQPEPERPAPPPESPPHEAESRFARRSKLFGLLGAAALLTGSIAAAAMLRDRPPEYSTGTVQPAEAGITGAAALGGFAIPAPRGSAPTSSPPPATSETTSTGETTTGTGGTTAAQVVPGTVSPAAGTSSTTTPPGKRELVEQFYRRMDVDPTGALSMLTDALAGDHPGDLVRAWTAMDSVQVENVREQSDGSVLAVVTMFDDDGRQLRITQQLWFADGGLISDARLLSAQHTS